MEELGPSHPKSFTLRYCVKRNEVSNWYWAAWRRADGLWQYWLLFLAIAVATSLILRFAFGLDNSSVFLAPALVYVGAICYFVIFPQWKYKPNERTLTVDAGGITTTRGTDSAQRSWKDIAAIYDRPGYRQWWSQAATAFFQGCGSALGMATR
jgi:hypothetical protein